MTGLPEVKWVPLCQHAQLRRIPSIVHGYWVYECACCERQVVVERVMPLEEARERLAEAATEQRQRLVAALLERSTGMLKQVTYAEALVMAAKGECKGLKRISWKEATYVTIKRGRLIWSDGAPKAGEVFEPSVDYQLGTDWEAVPWPPKRTVSRTFERITDAVECALVHDGAKVSVTVTWQE